MKSCTCIFTKDDNYLDLTYWSIQIIYWDGEKINLNNQPALTFGDVLLPVLDMFESTGENLSIVVNISDKAITDQLQNITGQQKLKESKVKSSLFICPKTKEADRLKKFINFHDVSVFSY